MFHVKHLGSKIMAEGFFEWLHRIAAPTRRVPKDISKLTKKELELKGREIGIELDRRFKKETLVKQLKKQQRKVRES
tara:strand:- start:97 stop:327 length:231 start_codon:yes stop_codon:yes gene_type:complete